MHYGREFLSIQMWNSEKAQHLRETCARVSTLRSALLCCSRGAAMLTVSAPARRLSPRGAWDSSLDPQSAAHRLARLVTHSSPHRAAGRRPTRPVHTLSPVDTPFCHRSTTPQPQDSLRILSFSLQTPLFSISKLRARALLSTFQMIPLTLSDNLAGFGNGSYCPRRFISILAEKGASERQLASYLVLRELLRGKSRSNDCRLTPME